MSEKKPLICMIIPTFYPVVGGTQSQVTSLCRELHVAGWNVQVVTRQHSLFHPDGLPATATVADTPVRRIYSRGKLGAVWFFVWGLWYLARHARGQVYHAHDVGVTGWLAVIARYLLRGHVIVKLRTGRMAYNSLHTSVLRRWQFGLLLRLADVVHVVSSEGEQIAREVGIPPQRIIRFANSIDTTFYCPAIPETKQQLRETLELPLDKTIVLYVGRLEYIKGIDVLLSAWARLPDAVREQARLVVLGDSSIRDEVYGTYSLYDSVDFRGTRSNTCDYYQAADMLVLPSRAEGVSNSMIEAMSSGLPVLGSNVGGAVDFIEPERNGLLFESEQVDDLVRKLEDLLGRRADWPQMGRAGREKVLAEANLACAMSTLQQLYIELAGE